MTAVGVLGLGRMGAPVAGHLVAAGHEVAGYDPDPDAGPGLASVRRVAAAEDLADGDVLLVLAGGPAVPALLLDPDGGWSRTWAGVDVLVCSTVDPHAMRELHAAAEASGARLLDAPLCRGDHGARSGDLLALVGGDPAVLDRRRHVLSAFCSDVVHVGGPGAGQVAKLVNNMLLWSTISAVTEGLRLAEELGVPRGPLVDGLQASSARSWVLETWARPRELPWAQEDMRLVLAAAERVGLPTPVAEVVSRVVDDVRRSGRLDDGGFGDRGWALPAGPRAGDGAR